MKDLSEAEIGWERIGAIVARSRVMHDVTCERCGLVETAEFWLALLGWTPVAFMLEAYPELYGGAE